MNSRKKSYKKAFNRNYDTIQPSNTISPPFYDEYNEYYHWIQSFYEHIRIISNTDVVSWGRGLEGCLGHNNTVDHETPFPIGGLRSQNIQSISAGSRISLFLTETGEVYQCGRIQAIVGVKSWLPSKVRGLENIRISSISAGLQSGFAVSEICSPDGSIQEDGGKVYSWGNGANGTLGHESDENYLIPRRIQALEKYQIIQVSTGMYYTIALSTSGQVFSWGKGNDGQLGHGNANSTYKPQLIDSLLPYFVLKVSAGEAHVLCIAEGSSTENGSQRCLFSWGRGLKGCLGHGIEQNEYSPCEVEFFRSHRLEKIATGSDHSLVLCAAGSHTFVYAFGGNAYGQLGIDRFNDAYLPVQIRELNWYCVTSIDAGAQYSMAITGDGKLFSWGDGAFGRTCQDLKRTTIAPWQIETLENRFVLSVSAGKYHVIAILRSKTLEMTKKRQYEYLGPVPLTNSSYLHQKESTCECKNAQVSSSAPFLLFQWCRKCEIGPLCRVCTRRCHKGHDIHLKVLNYGHHNCCCTTMNQKCQFQDVPPIPYENDDLIE